MLKRRKVVSELKWFCFSLSLPSSVAVKQEHGRRVRQRAFIKPEQHKHEQHEKHKQHKISVAFLFVKDFLSRNSLLKSNRGKKLQLYSSFTVMWFFPSLNQGWQRITDVFLC